MLEFSAQAHFRGGGRASQVQTIEAPTLRRSTGWAFDGIYGFPAKKFERLFYNTEVSPSNEPLTSRNAPGGGLKVKIKN